MRAIVRKSIMTKKNNGDDVLYHFFQKQLAADDPQFAESFIRQAIVALGIWIHPKFYQELPVILPFVVRDNSCRNKQTEKDEWGSPNAIGLLRDDNSLVKGIVRSMPVISPKRLYSKSSIGNGFVASHVWRITTENSALSTLASRDPWLNTFVPNLIWLPKQISKMTDNEGSFAQQYVQALSRHIYLNWPVKKSLQVRVQQIWDKLPTPSRFINETFPSMGNLNFFEFRQNIIDGRKKKISNVIAALEEASSGNTLERKIIAARYSAGLSSINCVVLKKLAAELQNYLNELEC